LEPAIILAYPVKSFGSLAMSRSINSLSNLERLFEDWRGTLNLLQDFIRNADCISLNTFIAQRKRPGDFSSGPSLYYFFQCRLLLR
jgi:hypothetical protein